MTIPRIREAYEAVKKSEGTFWRDEEFIDLISAIAEFIIKSPPTTGEQRIPEGCITIDAFIDLYPVFSKTVLLGACHKNRENPGFYQIKRLWYVHPEAMLPYLKESMKSYERRMKLMERMRNSVQ